MQGGSSSRTVVETMLIPTLPSTVLTSPTADESNSTRCGGPDLQYAHASTSETTVVLASTAEQ